jgi:hypothetical protein
MKCWYTILCWIYVIKYSAAILRYEMWLSFVYNHQGWKVELGIFFRNCWTIGASKINFYKIDWYITVFWLEYPLGALLHVPEINDEVERELSYIRKENCYQAVVPRLVPSVSSRFESSAAFFYGWVPGWSGHRYRLRESSGVFTSELSAIFMALVQIRDH